MHDNIESVDGVNDREKCLSEEKKITKKKKKKYIEQHLRRETNANMMARY